jgi:ribosomal protein S27AE
MTVRQVIGCEVCGATTLLRTQLGWLRQHPIRIPCGRCGITILGEVNLFPETAGFDFKFKNARRLEDTELA